MRFLYANPLKGCTFQRSSIAMLFTEILPFSFSLIVYELVIFCCACKAASASAPSAILDMTEPAKCNRWINLSVWLVSNWTVKFDWRERIYAVFLTKPLKKKRSRQMYVKYFWCYFWRIMYRKECKDSHDRVCLSRLTRVLDINMLEDLQQLEHTGNVARNLEIDSNLKPQRSFFSKSSEKISKIMNRKGENLLQWINTPD